MTTTIQRKQDIGARRLSDATSVLANIQAKHAADIKVYQHWLDEKSRVVRDLSTEIRLWRTWGWYALALMFIETAVIVYLYVKH